MNFLAHAYLSFDHPKVLVGNFIGDFVRGNLKEQFEKEIVIGILLHREIDDFTDQHPLVKEAQNILKPTFYKYSPVITDMFFDYFLSKNWKKYDHRTIFEFSQEVYRIIDQHEAILPEKFTYPYKYMKRENWLLTYGTLEGIKRAFTGLSYRTTFDYKLDNAPDFLVSHHNTFEHLFGIFFPELVSFSRRKLKELIENYDSL